MSVLLDATVLLKAFVSETGHTDARALVTSGSDLVVVDLVFAELARLVDRKVTRGEISEDHGLAILDTAPTFVRAVGVTGPVARRGYEIGRALGTTPADGLYLACADALDLPIVTADLVLASKVQGTEWQRRIIELGSSISQ